MELTAMLPWWVGVVLAVIAYFALHLYATSPSQPPAPGQPFISPALVWKPLATIFQYLLPVVFVAGAALSAIRRGKRKQNFDHVVGAQSKSALLDMTWQEFEALVGEAFRLRGFNVTETGGTSGDGGVDLVLRKGSDKYLVQCKQWRATRVGVAPVRELFGVMAIEGAAGGYIVTSGSFTEEAR